MTNSPEIFERPVMRSSVTPSLKYSCAGSRLRFAKGRTATDGLSGNASPDGAGVLNQRQPTHPPAPIRTRRAIVPATEASEPSVGAPRAEQRRR